MKSGEKHSYNMTLKAGEYLHVDVEQQNIDVAVVLIGPSGSTILERDRPTVGYGNESLSYISRKGGEYRIDINALTEVALAGEYDVKSNVKPWPNIHDRKRIRAETVFEEGHQMMLAKAPEDRVQACPKFETAAVLWRSITDVYAEAMAQTTIGECVAGLAGRPDQAVKPFERSLLLYRQLNATENVISLILGLGRLNINLGQFQRALKYYTEVLPYWQRAQNTWMEADTICTMGRIHLLEGRYGESIDLYVKTLPIWRSIPDKKEESKALYNIGSAYAHLNDNKKALEYLNQSLDLIKETDELEGWALTLSSIGGIYAGLNEMDTALRYFEDALAIWKKGSDKTGLARAFHDIGATLAGKSKDREAVTYLSQAVDVSRSIPDEMGEAASLNLRGVSYGHLGQHEKALEDHKAALPIFKKNNDRPSQLICLHNISRTYLSLNQFDAALDNAKQMQSLIKTEKDIRTEINALYNIGATYVTLSEIKQGLTLYQQALALFKQLEKTEHDRNVEADIWVSVGIALTSRQKYPEALEYYNRALPIFEKSKNWRDKATTLSNIAKIYAAQGDRPKALQVFNDALSIAIEYGFKGEESSILLNIGLTHKEMDKAKEAIDFYNQALLASTLIGDGYVRLATLTDLMADLKEMGDPRLAIFFGKQCINIIQKIRANMQRIDDNPQRAFLKNVDNMYSNLAVQLIEQGRYEEAHQVLNALKDQEYFDSDPKKIKKPLPLSLTPREINWISRYEEAAGRIRDIDGERGKLELMIGSGTPDAEETAKLQKIEARLTSAKGGFLGLIDEARRAFKSPPSPEQDTLQGIEDTQKMQDVLKKSGGKAIAIYTILGGYDYHALIVTPQEIIPVSSPIKRGDLNIKGRQLWALLQTDEYDPRILSKEVYDLIFKPIKDALIKKNKLDEVLPEGATILWSLDDTLRYVPMSALYDGEKYLVERYNNVVFTRADTDNWSATGPKNWTGFGFGTSRAATVKKFPYSFPVIPNSINELNAVFTPKNSTTGIFKGEIFPERQFTRKNMVAALQRPDPHPLIHITSHFYFSPGDRSGSFLLLGNGDIFTLDEMKEYPDLFKGVELLTLSACETAAQRPDSDGREVDGFAELAQRQGAAAVIATLWNVTEDSSYLLMQNFYERKRNPETMTKAEALRLAQMDFLSGAVKRTTGLSVNRRLKIKGRGNSTSVKVLPTGKEYPIDDEDDVVWVEKRYAKLSDASNLKNYTHPYFWSPFILFGNWR